MTASRVLQRGRRLLDRPLLLSLLLFLFILTLRLVPIYRYVTPDEPVWVYRSVLFSEALRTRQWSETLVSGHPGVITAWLGNAAITFQLALRPADFEVYDWLTRLAWLAPDNMKAFQQLHVFLPAGRLAIATVNSLALVMVFWLSWRLLGLLVASLATLFLALDLFLSGLSGLLHVDALLTSFVIIAILGLLLATSRDGENRNRPFRERVGYAFLAGGAAALAVLSKSPALLLLPLAVAVFLLSLWPVRRELTRESVAHTFSLMACWGASFALVTFLLFPALWSAPQEVLQLATSNATRHASEALRPSFFAGDVAFDHGPLFYPAVLAWRLSPLIFAGALLLVGLLAGSSNRRRLPLFTVFTLLLWLLLFLLLITVAAKKFDRYVLPVVPVLALLAAVAWSRLLSQGRWWRLLFGALLVLEVAYFLAAQPYPLAAYNPLLGGPFTAVQVLPFGWGESISEAGRWLSDQPGAVERTAVAGIAPSLAPFFSGETLPAEEAGPAQADYVILTANSFQENPEAAGAIAAELQLLHRVRYGFMEQAWVFANPRPIRDALAPVGLVEPVVFGHELALTGQESVVDDGLVRLATQWRKLTGNGRYLVKIRLLDENGLLWQELETPLLNEVYFYPPDWQAGETPVAVHGLELPLAAAPGRYTVELSLVDETSGGLVPIYGENGTFSGVVHQAGMVEVAPGKKPIPLEKLAMIPLLDPGDERENPRLLGHGGLPDQVTPGADLLLELFWTSDAPLPAGTQLALQLGAAEEQVWPLSRYDSGQWMPGTIVRERYAVNVPPDTPPGSAAVRLRAITQEGDALWMAPLVLGEVSVVDADRLFAMPTAPEMPLDVQFAEGVILRGADPKGLGARAGDAALLTLYWEATNGETGTPVTAFVHIRDRGGNIVAQADQWPGLLPSDTWAVGQVIVDPYAIAIPADVPPGEYEVAVGLYRAESGERLAAFDGAGNPYAGDQVILPTALVIAP